MTMGLSTLMISGVLLMVATFGILSVGTLALARRNTPNRSKPSTSAVTTPTPPASTTTVSDAPASETVTKSEPTPALNKPKHETKSTTTERLLDIIAVLAFAAMIVGALWYTGAITTSMIQSGMNWLVMKWPLLIVFLTVVATIVWMAVKHWKWIGGFALAAIAINLIHLKLLGVPFFPDTQTTSGKQVTEQTQTVPKSRSIRQEAVWSQPDKDGGLPLNVWSETYEILPGCKISFSGGVWGTLSVTV